ncbi:hypothetical protein GCM10010435_07080 [Winogradskya consettensis]|jgi:hypothetical protein|uniref:Uncharacterized protein n=2 Tax=Winogradskya TaxID=3240235 RepID=A0A919SRL9_9ACTN|nr:MULTISPECIES: hypothetical protein [Actinoplanes]GIE22038.1 hypothetical protein Ahu01nite_051400 [Actinoplanes humidus]GIM75803.1 hypothetical protein Aco04nite_47160 [Actinoplanes consettensis]
MQTLPVETLAAIGRMTVAATELEHLLAWIGADRAGGDAAAVFATPGEPLRAARGAVVFAPPAYREDLIGIVEGAATQLAISQSVLRGLWQENGRRNPEMFDEVAHMLLRCTDSLHELLRAALPPR